MGAARDSGDRADQGGTWRRARPKSSPPTVAGHTVATLLSRPGGRPPRPGRAAVEGRRGLGDLDVGRVRRPGLSARRGAQRAGGRPGDRVVLMMRNRPEFHVADVATLLARGDPGVDLQLLGPRADQLLARHCAAVARIVEDVDYLERVLKVRDELPGLEHVVVIDDDPGGPGRGAAFERCCGTSRSTSTRPPPPRPPRPSPPSSTRRGRPARRRASCSTTPTSCGRSRACAAAFEPKDPSRVPASCRTCRWPTSRSAMMSHYQGISVRVRGHDLPRAAPHRRVPARHPTRAVLRGAARSGRSCTPVSSPRPRRTRRKPPRSKPRSRSAEQAQAYRAEGKPLPAGLAAECEAHEPTLSFVRQVLGLDQVVTAITGAAPLPREVLTSSGPSASSCPRSTGSPSRRGR